VHCTRLRAAFVALLTAGVAGCSHPARRDFAFKADQSEGSDISAFVADPEVRRFSPEAWIDGLDRIHDEDVGGAAERALMEVHREPDRSLAARLLFLARALGAKGSDIRPFLSDANPYVALAAAFAMSIPVEFLAYSHIPVGSEPTRFSAWCACFLDSGLGDLRAEDSLNGRHDYTRMRQVWFPLLDAEAAQVIGLPAGLNDWTEIRAAIRSRERR
jgi:hypothetical protein